MRVARRVMALLETRALSKSFGGLRAIQQLEMDVEEGSIHGLIGPNGSGKSTFFNLVTGVYKTDPGSVVRFAGEDITNFEAHEIGRRGVARTFQLLRLFSEMTVLQNLLVGYHTHTKYAAAAPIFRPRSVIKADQEASESMLELLSIIGLAEFADMPAGELSGGQRRLLSLGRAIAMRPKLLMLDEPAAGLSPANVDVLMGIVLDLKKRYGLTLLIVEHILKVVMDTCDCVTVLDHGQKIGEGAPHEVKDDHAVVEAYLGKEMSDEEVRAAFEKAAR
jgi:branched-chain amino acid transport system ATP-binding protein